MTTVELKDHIINQVGLRWNDLDPITPEDIDLNMTQEEIDQYYTIHKVFIDSRLIHNNIDDIVVIHYGDKTLPSEAQIFVNEISLIEDGVTGKTKK